MKFNLMDVKVGDPLYDSGIRSDRRLQQRERIYIVEKVARKYITAVDPDSRDGFTVQVDRETGRLKADWNSHQFYRSKDEYIATLRRRKICVALNSAFVGYGTNLFEGVPTSDVLEAMRLLQIPYTEDGVYVDKQML